MQSPNPSLERRKRRLHHHFRTLALFAKKPRGIAAALIVGIASLTLTIVGLPGAYRSSEIAVKDWIRRHSSTAYSAPARPDTAAAPPASGAANQNPPVNLHIFDGVQFGSEQDAIARAKTTAATLARQIRDAERTLQQDKHELAMVGADDRIHEGGGPTDGRVQAAIQDLQSKDERLEAILPALRKRYRAAEQYMASHEQPPPSAAL